MAALQILVLSVQVRILVGQPSYKARLASREAAGLFFLMIIRNCHKKYNLCRNDAAASPFGKGCHEVAGYVSNNHTLLTPKCFSIGNYLIETYPQPLYSVTHSATVSRASSWTLRFHAFRKSSAGDRPGNDNNHCTIRYLL